MTVLASRRRESKLKVIYHSVELRAIMVDFMQRNFAVRKGDLHLRARYTYYNRDTEQAFAWRMELLRKYKVRVDDLSNGIIMDLYAANSIYPKTWAEYEQRRLHQTDAIVKCEMLKATLQQVCDTFNVNVNSYRIPIEAINEEKRLVKKWRQTDNRLKSKLGQNKS